ncbi:hypothetical protein [Vitiosangium sp. GDMCC 1.1324]|uniref:hypothetical protein n=1 Tax=Vitiosangium sp. (strain GDMCC 1.1324) TaxID=2138576 RepID=UPI000D33A12D|nr:hypothetical protein [Vitiosangium sp. GDMCC 1.1324]PTL83101.1 hypothetical protein DAT35_13895 [Vitiosangium sp. GDMCC 1.1324]
MSYSYRASASEHAYEPAPIRAELIVRPDLLRVSFSASLETQGVEQSLPLLQRACEQFQRRVRDALGTEVTFRPKDARFNRSAPRKLALPEDDGTFVAVDGTFEVPLPPEPDFWARSSRVGTLARACHEAQADSRQSKKLPRFSFGSVEALVAQPESHRAELLRRVVTRVRELATTVGSAEAPLHVVDCSAPGLVEQSPVSLEEVGLTLNVYCRLGVLKER